MIKIFEKEYLEGSIGIREKVVTFLGMEVYKYKKTTSNAAVVAKFKGTKQTKVKGYEIKD